MGRKKLELNQGLCVNGCNKPIHCKGICKNCYRKWHYETRERNRRYPEGISKERESIIGTLRTDTSGYVYIKVDKGSSGLSRNWMKYHRYIMEQHLGRKLLPEENVHHINGNKSDNRIENLELWITKQPKGQRPNDLIEYAKWILENYE